jgi:hypothetical protein
MFGNYTNIYCIHVTVDSLNILLPFLYIGGIVFCININAQARQLNFVCFRRESGGK